MYRRATQKSLRNLFTGVPNLLSPKYIALILFLKTKCKAAELLYVSSSYQTEMSEEAWWTIAVIQSLAVASMEVRSPTHYPPEHTLGAPAPPYRLRISAAALTSSSFQKHLRIPAVGVVHDRVVNQLIMRYSNQRIPLAETIERKRDQRNSIDHQSHCSVSHVQPAHYRHSKFFESFRRTA